jgi:dTDP-glucose 4,6-dehydratase
LNWKPRETFESGIRKTIVWYLQNDDWLTEVTNGTYRQWVAMHYSQEPA